MSIARPRVVLAGNHVHREDALRVLRGRSDVEIVRVLDLEEPEPWEIALADRPTACMVYGRASRRLQRVAAAVDAGLAVFVEKPLAADAPSAERVAALLDERAQIGLFLRYCPAIAELRRRVRNGDLGRVTCIRATFVHDGWRRGWFDGAHDWMASPAEGGGGFFDLGVHCLDAIENVGGAIMGVRTVELASAHHGRATVELDGAVGHIEAGWEADGMRIEVEVVGERGRARTSGGRLHVDGEPILDEAPPAAASAIEVWLDRLVGKPAPPLVEPGAAVRCAEHIDALRRCD